MAINEGSVTYAEPEEKLKRLVSVSGGAGNVESMTNLIRRGLQPTLVAAGVAVPMLDADGKPMLDDKEVPMGESQTSGDERAKAFYRFMVHQPEGGRR